MRVQIKDDNGMETEEDYYNNVITLMRMLRSSSRFRRKTQSRGRLILLDKRTRRKFKRIMKMRLAKIGL